MTKMSKDWWKSSVVYQIYPQSFKDSNDDGIGDLRGIIEKLSYLSKLGIDVVWLNPIYKSPLVDNGYDIENYREINPIYGTMADFEELLEKAHQMNIKIIMDLVVNHTSDQHQWFKESKLSKDNKYADFYIWKDAKEDGSLPNNWGATFGGSAWSYVPERNQYYLHCFAPEQPDLNWENPEVRKAVYDEMRFWLDKGIDGFRMDVISLISKRQDIPDAADGEYDYSKSYYKGASNGPRVHEFLQEMNREVLSHYDVMTVGETANTTVEQEKLYTDTNNKELNMVFQFDHMHLDYGKYGKFSDIKFKLSDLKKSLTLWAKELDEGWNSLYWNNHDQPRAVSRFGDDGKYREESAKMLGTLLHMMKGTPYIFQGEELGMKNVPFKSLEQYKDIETIFVCKKMKENGEDEEYIKKCAYLRSRDNARTPFPWNGQDDAGFSKGKPWIDHSPDNKEINLENELKDKNSVFYYYQKLIQIRKENPIVVEGTFELIDENDSDIFAYERKYKDQILLCICSFSSQRVNYTLPKNCQNRKLIISNYDNILTKDDKTIMLEPYQAIVYMIER